jgi:hypothetical protein
MQGSKDEADREHGAFKIIIFIFAQRLPSKIFCDKPIRGSVVCVNQ